MLKLSEKIQIKKHISCTLLQVNHSVQPELQISVSEESQTDFIAIAVQICAHEPYRLADSDVVMIGEHAEKHRQNWGCFLQCQR